MQVKRLTLAVGIETAFEFDEFYSRSVMVKNMTSDSILFCDGPFNEAKAAVIPSYSWQIFSVTLPYGETPKLYVKATVAGDVEVCFGSEGMGMLGNALDVAGMIPHTLTLTAGEGTTLTASLVRQHGQTLDLDSPVVLTSGATVFTGDVVSFAATVGDGEFPILTINGKEIDLNEGSVTYAITGETLAELNAAPDEEE